MFRSVASLGLSILLVNACGATPSPSLAPSASASMTAVAASPPVSVTPNAAPLLTPGPTSVPAPTGWPYELRDSEPVFAPDGTVYLLTRDAQGEYQRIVVALDPAGHVKPGWSIEAPPGSDFGSLAVGPDGSVYIDECGGLAVGCVLHRFGPDGRDLPGWPFDIPEDFSCPAGDPYDTDDPRTPAVGDPCPSPSLAIGPNGIAYLTNQRAEGPRLIAVDTSGTVKPGWPIALDDQDWSDQQVGSDGTVYLIRRPSGTPTYDETRGRVDDDAELWAFGADGKPRPGWPVPVPNIGGYLLGPRGTVIEWALIDDMGELCSNPRRTLFTVHSPDGRRLPGWPRGSTGFASRPVVDADGTVFYISATGKVYAHDRAGEVKTGWPVVVPGTGNGCGPANPYLAPDGTIYAVGEEVAALSPDGRSRPGWPFRPAGQLIVPCIDTDCVSYPVPPAFGPDGTVYLVVYQADPAGARLEVAALDRQGQIKPGWPYRLSFDPASIAVGPLITSPDGRLYVRGGNALFALDPDGRISD